MNPYKRHFQMYWCPRALVTAEQACRKRFFVLFQRYVFFQTCPFLTTIIYFMTIFENTKYTRNAKPFWKMVDFRPELSHRPGWRPKRCPIVINLLCIFRVSGTVPTYGVAVLRTYPPHGAAYVCNAIRLHRFIHVESLFHKKLHRCPNCCVNVIFLCSDTQIQYNHALRFCVYD